MMEKIKKIQLQESDFDTSRLTKPVIQLWSWAVLECPFFKLEDAIIAVKNKICYIASDTSIVRIDSKHFIMP